MVTSKHPYIHTHTPSYPGTHVRMYLSTQVQMYIQMYRPIDIHTSLDTCPDRSLQILKKMAHSSADMYIDKGSQRKNHNIQLQRLANRRPQLSGGCGLWTLGAQDHSSLSPWWHEHVGWFSKKSTCLGTHSFRWSMWLELNLAWPSFSSLARPTLQKGCPSDHDIFRSFEE